MAAKKEEEDHTNAREIEDLKRELARMKEEQKAFAQDMKDMLLRRVVLCKHTFEGKTFVVPLRVYDVVVSTKHKQSFLVCYELLTHYLMNIPVHNFATPLHAWNLFMARGTLQYADMNDALQRFNDDANLAVIVRWMSHNPYFPRISFPKISFADYKRRSHLYSGSFCSSLYPGHFIASSVEVPGGYRGQVMPPRVGVSKASQTEPDDALLDVTAWPPGLGQQVRMDTVGHKRDRPDDDQEVRIMKTSTREERDRLGFASATVIE